MTFGNPTTGHQKPLKVGINFPIDQKIALEKKFLSRSMKTQANNFSFVVSLLAADLGLSEHARSCQPGLMTHRHMMLLLGSTDRWIQTSPVHQLCSEISNRSPTSWWKMIPSAFFFSNKCLKTPSNFEKGREQTLKSNKLCDGSLSVKIFLLGVIQVIVLTFFVPQNGVFLQQTAAGLHPQRL